MYRKQSIRSIIAAGMLLLFALSVTPKQLLHNLITGHKHCYGKIEGAATFQTSKNGFQCNWHNDAVESPFTNQPGFQFSEPVPVYSSFVNQYHFSDCSATLLFSSLRGPPAKS